MLLSALSVLAVAQSSSEIPEGLMNNPVLIIYEFQLLQVDILILDIPHACCMLHLCFIVQHLFVKPEYVAFGYKKHVLCLTVLFIGFFILTQYDE